MDIDIKKDLSSNWFKLLQNAICDDIIKLEKNKLKFKSTSWKRNTKKDEGGGEYKILKNELNRSKKRPKSSRRHRCERRILVDCDSHTSYLNNPKSKSYLLRYLIPLKRTYQYKTLEIELNRAKKLSVRWSSKITSEAVLATQRDSEKISKPPVYSE